MKPCTLFVAVGGLLVASIAAAASPSARDQIALASARVAQADAAQPMLWLGNQRIAFGVGQRRGPSLALPQPDQTELALGIGVKLTPAATITFESDARALRSHESWVSDDASRVGLSFRTTSKSREVKSLLTVQLSGQSVFQLRPRGSGLRAVYTAAF